MEILSCIKNNYLELFIENLFYSLTLQNIQLVLQNCTKLSLLFIIIILIFLNRRKMCQIPMINDKGNSKYTKVDS